MVVNANPLRSYEDIRGSFVRAIAKAERFLKSNFGIDSASPQPRAVDLVVPPWDEYSLAKSHVEVEFLLNKGLRTRPLTDGGVGNPLTQVMCNLPAGERADAVTAMLTKGNANPVHNYGVGATPLQAAAHLGDPKVIGALMDHGATFDRSEFFALTQGALHRLDVARDSKADRREWVRIMGGLKDCLSEAFQRMGEDKTNALLRDFAVQHMLNGSAKLRETIHSAQQVFDTRDWTQKTKVGINLSGPRMG